jgi:hypothetical protein
MGALLGRVGLFSFYARVSHRENPKKDGAVESHPSAEGALGWGTRECFLESSLEGRAFARPAGGDARRSIVLGKLSVFQTLWSLRAGIALEYEFACEPASFADAFETH